MKIAITGASGHLGVNLCRDLLNLGHSLRCLVHHNEGSLKDILIESVKGDLMDYDSLLHLVEGADAVIHLAAVISIRGRGREDMMEKNVEGTRRIIRALREARIGKYIHISSIHALKHEPYDQPLDENRPLSLADRMSYSRSKARAEKIVLEAVQQGLDAVILNPTAFIGPYDYGPSLLGRALLLMAANKLPSLIPGGYDWVDVRDVSRGIIFALEKGRPGERYILPGKWLELRELSLIISRLTGGRPMKRICPGWLALLGLPFLNAYGRLRNKEPLYTRDSLNTLKNGHRLISGKKAAEELGYKARPIEVTLKDTLEWFKERGLLS